MITQSSPPGAPAIESALSLSGERPMSHRPSSEHDLAWSRALGWFSIGVGLVELAAPSRLARSIGVGDHRLLVRALGVREIISGVGILTQRLPAGWMLSRVAGDALDLALLGAAFRGPDAGRRRTRVALATAAVAGVTMADLVVSLRLTQGSSHGGLVQVSQSVTINRSADDLYAVWRRFENLPPMLPHLASVRAISDTRSHWVVRGPAGTSVEWDADIVEDRPNERIAWQSLTDADIRHAGSVHFRPAPGQRGTEVAVTFEYAPPAGRLGSAVARLFGVEPAQQVYEGLRAFKQIMETGEILRSDASIHRGMHPAQPPAVGVSR